MREAYLFQQLNIQIYPLKNKQRSRHTLRDNTFRFDITKGYSGEKVLIYILVGFAKSVLSQPCKLIVKSLLKLLAKNTSAKTYEISTGSFA